jgi:hypothetical protein
VPAFYYALRDTLVADELESATKLAFSKERRYRYTFTQLLSKGNALQAHTCTYSCVTCPALKSTVVLKERGYMRVCVYIYIK